MSDGSQEWKIPDNRFVPESRPLRNVPESGFTVPTVATNEYIKDWWGRIRTAAALGGAGGVVIGDIAHAFLAKPSLTQAFVEGAVTGAVGLGLVGGGAVSNESRIKKERKLNKAAQ
jgi:hypothetical protein